MVLHECGLFANPLYQTFGGNVEALTSHIILYMLQQTKNYILLKSANHTHLYMLDLVVVSTIDTLLLYY